MGLFCKCSYIRGEKASAIEIPIVLIIRFLSLSSFFFALSVRNHDKLGAYARLDRQDRSWIGNLPFRHVTIMRRPKKEKRYSVNHASRSIL